MRHNQIYIVDDDKDVLRSLSLLFRSLRLECRTYESGEALLSAIPDLPAGCVLTDMRMPGMSGLDLQSELYRRGYDWPLIFMTGNGEVSTAVAALKKGAVEFMEKPFSDEQLLSAVHAAFSSLRETSNTDARSYLDEVRSALQTGDIAPHYQPKVELSSGGIFGFEALARWGGRGSASDSHVIHKAFADRGLGRPLSHRMLDAIFNDVRSWLDASIPFGHVALNASAADLADPDYPADLLERMKQSNISPADIHIEVTESVSIAADSGPVRESLSILQDSGIQIALDDFGTGYASLAHLQDLPFDELKIDRGFLARWEEASSASIIKAIIGLGKGLNKRVVGEGVETKAQADFLQQHGCEYAQGFLFGRPTVAAGVRKVLSNNDWA